MSGSIPVRGRLCPHRSGRVARSALIAALAGVLVLTACGPQAPSLVPIPTPDLAALEPAVQQQLRDARTAFDARIATAGLTPAASAIAYGDLGMRYHAQGIREPADASYVNAERLAPTDPQWPYYLGMVRRDSGRVDDAIAEFKRVIELEPTNAAAQLQLAQLYIRTNRNDDAITLAQSALAQADARAAALAILGKAELAKGDYPHAAQHLEEALQLVPTATKLHQPLAMAYRGLGNTAGAEQQLALHNEKGAEPLAPDPRADKLAELTEGSVSYLARGERAVQAKQYELAQQAFEKAVAMDASNANAHLNLGVSYSKVDRLIDARDQFQSATRLAPNDPAAHFGLGVIYDRLELDSAAADEYRRVIALDPQHVKARFFLAETLVRLQQYPAAFEQYTWIIDRQKSRQPEDAEVPLHLAMAQARIGRYADARKTLETALTQYGKHAQLWNALARVLASAPDASVRDARRSLSMASELFGAVKDVDYAQTLAMALAESGRFADAATLQRVAIRKAPEQGRTALLPFMNANLTLFDMHRPARTAWPNDNSLFRSQPSSVAPNAPAAPAPAAGAPAATPATKG